MPTTRRGRIKLPSECGAVRAGSSVIEDRQGYYEGMVQRTRHLIVMGMSAGGIETLRTVLGGLPPDFGAPICVVMHTPPDSPGVLADILNRFGSLPSVAARRAERLQPGRVYVAPPDCHLIIEPGIV